MVMDQDCEIFIEMWKAPSPDFCLFGLGVGVQLIPADFGGDKTPIFYLCTT